MKKIFSQIASALEAFTTDRYSKIRKIICLLFLCGSLFGVLMLYFQPICAAKLHYSDFPITAAGFFDSVRSSEKAVASFAVLQLAAFVIITASAVYLLYKLLEGVFLLSREQEMLLHTKKTVIFAGGFIGVYTLLMHLFSPVNVLLGGLSSASPRHGVLWFILILLLLFALYFVILTSFVASPTESRAKQLTDQHRKLRKSLFWKHLELTVLMLASAAVTLVALLSDIVTVDFKLTTVTDITFSGRSLLENTDLLTNDGERVIAYFVFVLMILTLSFAFVALIAFISRSAACPKTALAGVIVSSASCLIVGLFGQYYRIIQHLNIEIVNDYLEKYGLEADTVLDYTLSSPSLYYFLGSLLVLTVLFLRRPYTKSQRLARSLQENEVLLQAVLPAASLGGGAIPASVPASESSLGESGENFDPCPAFTEIDQTATPSSKELEQKRRALFEEPSLPRLTDFIVQYARDSRLHLFYTSETVAAFLAGLGTTRLTILQGMSGTGKTSLPKIVAEALHSVCNIVEVESSWRDKNELLGYYNEFNKVYTPKKFTQALYRAALDPETVTFIVLDEMNLSRIEYYFSDFLSLMENEADKRELKLLNTPLFRVSEGNRIGYKGLQNGHTLKIPSNVWFIGTANRDESTYDISDKVYDRAHTMNFDKRASRPHYYNEPASPRYLPASELCRLFEEAKKNVRIELEQYPVVAQVEKLLAPYHISFGNRIALQMESFVGIYASCFAVNDAVIHDALEIILLSKVVRKLELKSIEDKERLAFGFEELGLSRCAAFVNSLKED